MNKEVTTKISKAKLKGQRRRNAWIRKQQMQREHIPSSNSSGNVSNINRFSFRSPVQFDNSNCLQQIYRSAGNYNFPSGFSLPETAFRSNDASFGFATLAASSANHGEFRNDGQEFLQQTCSGPTSELKNVFWQTKPNLYEREKKFQEDLKMLLDACQNVHFQSQTPDFYLDKMKSLSKNHIQELLKEKDKLDIEFQQAHEKVKESQHLIMKRLNSIENVLCSSTVLNKFLMLQMEEILMEEKKEINAIKIKLIDSVGSNINSSIIKENEANKEVSTLLLQLQQHAQNKQITIAKMNKANTQTDIIRRELKLTKDELKAVKKELEDKIIYNQQHAHCEQERVLEINKAKSETKTVSKEINNRINTNQQSPENEQSNKAANQNFKSKRLLKPQQELEYVKKMLNFKKNTIQQKIQQEQKLMVQLNKAEEEVCNLRNQLSETRNELADTKKELNDKVRTIQQKTQHEQEIESNKATEVLRKQGTELEEVRKKLSNDVIAVQQKPHQEHIIMDQLNKAEVNILRNQLIETQDELRVIRKELMCSSNTIQQKTQQEQKEMEEFNKFEKELGYKVITIKEKTQDEQKVMEELNKVEEEVNMLRNQLTVTQHELREVRKESSCRSNTIQQKTMYEQQMIEELKTVEKEYNMIQSRLTKALHELDKTRKELRSMGSISQQKAQLEQKRMIELNRAEEKVKVLHGQLEGAQNELKTVREESSNIVNILRQNAQQEQKVMEVGFSEIRLLLMKKLGFTEQNGHHFEDYMLEKCSRGMMSDIRKLIEDKVQLLDEYIPKTVNCSSILKVTENEVHLVISIASFLKNIPFSASKDFVYSFVAQIDNVISRQHVEDLLTKFPTIFKEESVGTGSADKNWRYLDLTPIFTI